MHGAELVPNRIFVAGLPQNTDQAELLEYFANISGSAANITEINIVNEKSGLSKGYGFVTFVSESEAKHVLGMDSESFVFKETKLIVSSAYMRPKYNLHHKQHSQTTSYHQSSQYFYKSKNLAANNHSAVSQEQKSECNSVESSSFTSPTPLTSSTHTCNTLDLQEGQEIPTALNQEGQANATLEVNGALLTSSSSSTSSSKTTSSSSLNVNRMNTNGVDSKAECAHDSNNNNPSESNLNQTLNSNAQPKPIESSSFKSREGYVSRRARNEDSTSSSTAAEYNQQPKSFNYQYQQRQPFNRFNLNNNNNKKSNARQFEQQLHIQTNPVHLSNKNASLTAAAAAIATSASSNSATLSPTSLKTQQSVSHQLQNPASNSFMRVGTSPSSFTKVKQKSANLEKIPNTSNLVGSVGSIVNKASMDAFNKVQHERQVASSSENGTANGANENKQISNAAYSLAATYANRSASINSSTLQSTGQQKPEAKPSQVGSAQRQRNKPSHTSPPHSFDYTLYKHHQQQQQQQQQQAQMVQMPAAMYPTAHAFYIAAATQYDSAANMANQQAKQYVHNASKQAISNNAATISNAFETVVSSGQQRTESNNNDSAHSYYAYNQMNTNKAVEEMDEMMKNKLSLANTVKNAEYDHSQMQAHQQQPQQQQIPTVYYYCPPSVTGQDLTLVQSQQQQHQPQQTLNGNACYYYYTPISPAPTNASMAHQTPQPQLTQLQTQQFVQTQPTQPKQAAQSSQPINYLAHYGYAEPYAVNTNVPVIQPQAHSYYAANLPLAQYPQANYYLNTQQFMALSQTQGAAAAANGLPQTNYHQSYAYVNPQSQLQQSSNQMKSAVNSHVQQQRPPSAPLHYYQSRSNTPKPVVYADQYMIDPSTFGMASSSNTTRGGKIKYSHSNRVAANQHRAINYQQQGHYSKANRTHETANRPTFGVPQNVISNQQAQQQGLTEQVQPN